MAGDQDSMSALARGNITPFVFIKANSAEVGTVLQADNTTPVYGVSGPGGIRVPLEGLQNRFHAINGSMCSIYSTPQKRVPITLAGTVAFGDYIGQNATGYGLTIPTTSNGAFVGGIAQQNGTVGQVINMLYQPQQI